MNITKTQIAAFYAILRQHNLQDDKVDIVKQISHNRTSSLRELTYLEAQSWINDMNQTGRNFAARQEKNKCQPMINKMIATAHNMGWIKEAAVVKPDGTVTMKKDYTDLHKWVNKYGYLKKPLNDYTFDELKILVSAFDKVYIAWLKREKV